MSRATAICGCWSARPTRSTSSPGSPIVYHNVFTGLDPKTGRPIVADEHKPGTGKKADFCPGLWGGKDWPPVAYSPKTKLLYIPANDNLCSIILGRDIGYVAGQAYTGVTSWMYIRKGADHIGEVQAWDLDSGKKVWTTNFGMSQNWGPILATAGDVLFSGGTNDRKFRAFDAKSGKVLWETVMPSGVNGVPMSFQVDGKQYVAVQSGWGVDAARMQLRLNLRAARRLSRSAAGRLDLGVRGRLGCWRTVARRSRSRAAAVFCPGCLSASRRACVARCA